MTFGKQAMTALALVLSTPVCAQVAGTDINGQRKDPAQSADSQGMIGDIVVTATKKLGGTNIQKANLSVTALDERVLNEVHLRNFAEVSFLAPNVILEGTSSFKGVANFSIRGQGITTSVASADPTVGTFVDGVYLGLNAGLVTDTFDVGRIEVLRGPQGVLFGRNVVAGAVLIETSRPTEELSVTARAAYETGPNYTASGVISGPVNKAGSLRAKAALYYNKDEGYFQNDGGPVHGIGGGRTWVGRAALEYKPDTDLDLLLRYEHGDLLGQGIVSQNHALYPRDADPRHASAINDPGLIDQKWNQITSQSDIGVALGGGTITNIAAYRNIVQFARSDTDGTPLTLNTGSSGIRQHQISEELRYAGKFGAVDLTVGGFYYNAYVIAIERRQIPATGDFTSGGEQRSSTVAIFGSADVHLTPALTLNLGARYSYEHKHAKVQPSIATGLCNVYIPTCGSYSFEGEKGWGAFSPKVGVQYQVKDGIQTYAYWARAQRSGGFNLRVSGTSNPGPYGQETQDTFEVGVKSDLLDRHLRINVAGYYNFLRNAQRDVSIATILGVQQTTLNTANLDIRGVEVEVIAKPTNTLTFNGSMGYTDSKFRKILNDISGDGIIDYRDYNLILPRLSPWTWNIGATLREPVSFGTLWATANYSHRDKTYSTDSNLGYIPRFNDLTASVGIDLPQGMSASVYIKNALNMTNFGNDNPLATVYGGPGATSSPLNKGRVVGVEASFHI